MPAFLHLSDPEAVKLITTGLLLVSNFWLATFAMKALTPGKPFRSGLYFLLMTLPLLLVFSSPGIALAPLDSLRPIMSVSAVHTMLFKLTANSIVFFLTGFLYILTGNAEKTYWKKALFVSFLLTALYILSLDTILLNRFYV